ncbi:hypothetical protein L7F22_014058 [Adiantum nelumboides]|nr:hypothetical protein [Adiantum nelumboides]
MKQFLLHGASDQVLTAWQSLKLEEGENMQRYVEKFWDLHLKALVYKRINFSEQKQQFCAGLPEEWRNYVNAQRPRTISKVIHHSMIASNIEFQASDKKPSSMAMMRGAWAFCAGGVYGVYIAQNYNVPDVGKLFRTAMLIARIYEENYRKKPPREDD